MANRYQSDDRLRRERLRRAYGRQEEQFETSRGFGDDDYGQMGDGWRDDQQSSWQSGRDYGDRSYGGGERFGASRYAPTRDRSFRNFTGNDFGGDDFVGGSTRYERERSRSYGVGTWGAGNYGAGSQLAANHGEWRETYGATPSRENRDYRDTWGGQRDPNERGLLERAGDTIAHWLGDDADYGRGESYRGRGPANYTRSDDRIRDDACDRLTDDHRVDASQVQVSVKNGEVTLDGPVPSREHKRRAEDCVEDLSGVRHVQNNLRVQERTSWGRNNGGDYETSQSKTTSKQA